MAITFDPSYRNTWMFPRNIRKIHPWRMAQICQILNQLSLNQNEWTQETQNEFSFLLANGNLKSQNQIRDPKSGGAKVYVAQLESFGLIYKDGKNIKLTLAGINLINFEQPLKVIQTQLLNYQFPNSYSLNGNVKINLEIKIKPFVFVFKFLKDPHIKYLQEDELVFLLVYGHNSNCFEFIKNKILSYRKENKTQKSLIDFIDNPFHDLYTPRLKSNEIKKMLRNVFEVAITIKSYLISSCLAYEDKMKKILFSNEYDDIINLSIESSEVFVPIENSINETSLTYNLKNIKKDISAKGIKKKKVNKGEAVISSQYFSYVRKNATNYSVEEFIVDMNTKFGFEINFVKRVINLII